MFRPGAGSSVHGRQLVQLATEQILRRRVGAESLQSKRVSNRSNNSSTTLSNSATLTGFVR